MSLVVQVLSLFIFNFGFFVLLILADKSEDDQKHSEYENYALIVWRQLACWSPFLIPAGFKIYYGFRWMRKHELQRSAFLPFYRMAVTHDWSNGVALVMLVVI